VDTVRDAGAYERYADTATRAALPVESFAQFAAHERVSEPTNTLVVLCDCAPPDRAARVAPLILAACEGSFVSSSPAEADAWPAHRVVPVGSPGSSSSHSRRL